MKIHQLKFALMLFILVTALTGCGEMKDNPKKIDAIPETANQVMTMELNGQSGTFTYGKIDVSGTGYLILEVQIQSGSIKALGLQDAAKDKIIYTINKPQNAMYDSAFYDYEADHEYKLYLGKAKDVYSTINVYFIPE